MEDEEHTRVFDANFIMGCLNSLALAVVVAMLSAGRLLQGPPLTSDTSSERSILVRPFGCKHWIMWLVAAFLVTANFVVSPVAMSLASSLLRMDVIHGPISFGLHTSGTVLELLLAMVVVADLWLIRWYKRAHANQAPPVLRWTAITLTAAIVVATFAHCSSAVGLQQTTVHSFIGHFVELHFIGVVFVGYCFVEVRALISRPRDDPGTSDIIRTCMLVFHRALPIAPWLAIGFGTVSLLVRLRLLRPAPSETCRLTCLC